MAGRNVIHGLKMLSYSMAMVLFGGWILPFQALACGSCISSVNNTAYLTAYYGMTVLLMVLGIGFLGAAYYIARVYGSGNAGNRDTKADENRPL